MAQRRMFSKSITESDAFIDMPLTTQALYFHLGMVADDEGFVDKPKAIMRLIGANQNDLDILIAKKFLLRFETGIVVIKHWKINNYLQVDRIAETNYKEERSELLLQDNGSYSLTFGEPLAKIEKRRKSASQEIRKVAYKESELPYNFNHWARTAFNRERCPRCGVLMESGNTLTQPTVQHNKPLTKGGKHELGNISVICRHCNSSIADDEETESYNTEEVTKKWLEYNGNVYTDGNVYTQISIGKDSIGKYRLDKSSIDKITDNKDNINENQSSCKHASENGQQEKIPETENETETEGAMSGDELKSKLISLYERKMETDKEHSDYWKSLRDETLCK